MSGASRKLKLSKYEVTIKREVEHTAVVEVEARNAEEAKRCRTTRRLIGYPKPYTNFASFAKTTAWRLANVSS